MQDDIAISVNNVSKNFRLPHEKITSIKSGVVSVFRRKNKKVEIQHALKKVSFDIKKGEFFGIVGRNGSGKSTLLKIIAGIYQPTDGSVKINGSLVPFIELGVGFDPELSGRENVYLNGALLGFSKKQIDRMYHEIVEFAELERFMDQKLKNYSSGMQVRLAFSVAIRAQSDILVLDEVLAVGDSAFQQKCFDYFDQMREDKKTVILVTHDMSAVKRFCSRAVFIEHGQIKAIGSPEDIADKYVVNNIESKQNNSDDSKGYSLTSELVNQTEKEVELKFSVGTKSSEDLYVGMSILHNGVSIAELTSETYIEINRKSKVRLTIPTRDFNPGVYELTSVLCRTDGRTLLTVSDNRVAFIVKGDDGTRGGAMKLKNTWSKD